MKKKLLNKKESFKFNKLMKLYIFLFMTFLISCNPIQKSSEETFKELIHEADSLYALNSDFKALRLYIQIIKTDSMNGKYYFNIAHCYDNHHVYDFAINYYLKSIELNYRIEDCNYNIGRCYALDLNDTMALFYSKKAYELNPLDFEAKNLMLFADSAIKEKKMNNSVSLMLNDSVVK